MIWTFRGDKGNRLYYRGVHVKRVSVMFKTMKTKKGADRRHWNVVQIRLQETDETNGRRGRDGCGILLDNSRPPCFSRHFDRRTTTLEWRYEIPRIHLEGSFHNKLGFVLTSGFYRISRLSRDKVRAGCEALTLIPIIPMCWTSQWKQFITKIGEQW